MEIENNVPVPETKVNTLGHLNPEIKPIMACVGIRNDFRNKDVPDPLKIFDSYDEVIEASKNSHNVDYYGHPEELANKKFKNKGNDSYVISPVDNLDKFSRSFVSCTGVIVAGKDKETGEDISFMSHQDPEYFLSTEEQREKFILDLEERLRELRDKCDDGTVDAVVLGGNFLRGLNSSGRNYTEDYLNSIKLLSTEISSILGFEPLVITGPKMKPGEDYVFYDNKNRRLYLKKPEVGIPATDSYQPKDIDEKKKDW